MRFRLLAALIIMATPLARAFAAPPSGAPVVTLLGDSITAGYGLPAAQALPAQLQAALDRMSVRAVVRGAGVSGDTTADGLARLDFSVGADTRLCVVELGANDYLQSAPPSQMAHNLAAIVRRLKARHIGVLLAGGTAPVSGSGAYGRAFNAVFAQVAKAEDVALEPDFLAGIEAHADLKQADGLHPNAAGVRLMAARLAASVAKALRSEQARRP